MSGRGRNAFSAAHPMLLKQPTGSSGSMPAMDLSAILAALSDPRAYDHPAPAIEVVETHASAVILAGEHVYKFKKPVDFGFLDYSTLERRKAMCEAEVELNQRLASGVYLGVLPITLEGGCIVLGGAGDPIEYAVHMRRLPEEATLSRKLDAAPLEAIGQRIAQFHAAARGGPEVARFASFECVAANLRENHVFLEAQAGRVAPLEELQRFTRVCESELELQRARIERRAEAGIARETHGDLRLEHVYVLPGGELVIVDCIEFSERFRCADPVSDIAFLAMDLQAHGAWDGAQILLDAYFAARGDEDGRALLPLYLAYRSSVRAKVRVLQAQGALVPAAEREHALQLARAHVQLALGELVPPLERPCLVLVGGLPGTGKSVLSAGLAEAAGFVWLRSDAIRKQLAGLEPTSSGRAELRGGIYTGEWNERTYGECLARAKELLFSGKRVLVDASFKDEGRRLAFVDAARDWGVPVRMLLCTSPAGEVRERLEKRAGDASDADWAIHEHVRRTWEPAGARTAPILREIDTRGTREQSLAQALGVLKSSRLS